jgi:hypothetical protein
LPMLFWILEENEIGIFIAIIILKECEIEKESRFLLSFLMNILT